MKFKVTQECDYVQGHLRYGHYEGIVEVKDEDELKEKIDPGDINNCGVKQGSIGSLDHPIERPHRCPTLVVITKIVCIVRIWNKM